MTFVHGDPAVAKPGKTSFCVSRGESREARSGLAECVAKRFASQRDNRSVKPTMFIATMYSYGNDTDAVGVDGIRGCLGIFLATKSRLFAVHIPEVARTYAEAHVHFVRHVLQVQPLFNRAESVLYAVANGANRVTAEDELREYGQSLGVHQLKMVRLQKHLGDNNSRDSVAAVLTRIPGSIGCMLKYLATKNVAWTRGIGTPRSGYYHNSSMAEVLSTTAALGQGWRLVDSNNSTISNL